MSLSSTLPLRKRSISGPEAYSSSTATDLVHALGEQCVGDVEETGYVGPVQIVAGGAVLFGCLVAGGVDILQTFVCP
jgi:hypothetical protein